MYTASLCARACVLPPLLPSLFSDILAVWLTPLPHPVLLCTDTGRMPVPALYMAFSDRPCGQARLRFAPRVHGAGGRAPGTPPPRRGGGGSPRVTSHTGPHGPGSALRLGSRWSGPGPAPSLRPVAGTTRSRLYVLPDQNLGRRLRASRARRVCRRSIRNSPAKGERRDEILCPCSLASPPRD